MDRKQLYLLKNREELEIVEMKTSESVRKILLGNSTSLSIGLDAIRAIAQLLEKEKQFSVLYSI